jgi:hypothetical protein
MTGTIKPGGRITFKVTCLADTFDRMNATLSVQAGDAYVGIPLAATILHPIVVPNDPITFVLEPADKVIPTKVRIANASKLKCTVILTLSQNGIFTVEPLELEIDGLGSREIEVFPTIETGYCSVTVYCQVKGLKLMPGPGLGNVAQPHFELCADLGALDVDPRPGNLSGGLLDLGEIRVGEPGFRGIKFRNVNPVHPPWGDGVLEKVAVSSISAPFFVPGLLDPWTGLTIAATETETLFVCLVPESETETREGDLVLRGSQRTYHYKLRGRAKTEEIDFGTARAGDFGYKKLPVRNGYDVPVHVTVSAPEGFMINPAERDFNLAPGAGEVISITCTATGEGKRNATVTVVREFVPKTASPQVKKRIVENVRVKAEVLPKKQARLFDPKPRSFDLVVEKQNFHARIEIRPHLDRWPDGRLGLRCDAQSQILKDGGLGVAALNDIALFPVTLVRGARVFFDTGLQPGVVDQYGTTYYEIPPNAQSLEAIEIDFAWGGVTTVTRFERDADAVSP